MVIECSSCHARFKLADDKIKSTGTKVRCTKCREVFSVFPESSPVQPVLTSPTELHEVPPNENIDQDNFNALLSDEVSLPSSTFPGDDDDDWTQNTSPSQFQEDSTTNIGSTDLDAISFDNIETPVFSVTTESNKLEFDDDQEFSFIESPHSVIDNFSEDNNEGSSEFNSDFPLTPPTLSANEDLASIDQPITTEEFTFAPTENLADFSWDEADSSPVETVPSEQLSVIQAPPQDSSFDFSSFSFDDVAAPVVSAKTDEADNISTNERNFELASEPLPSVTTDTIPQSAPHEQKVFPQSSQEIPRASARHLRTRSRTKKKGSSRFLIKAILLIFIVFALIFAFINREQIYTEYKNLVSRFIEKQVSVETNGRIGLVNLSGNYVVNNQNESMFVIRGNAVNEFKGLRSSVLVRGTIFDEKGAILQSQTAFCGNPIKDINLRKLSFKDIRYAMNNELGENLVNLNIASGKNVPFSIVFNDVPKSIKEFTVEVLESKAGSQ